METRVCWPGWETVRLIGKGSFGSVYEIQRDVFGSVEKAALKVISIPQSNNEVEELIADGYDSDSITQRFQGYLEDIVREYSLMATMKGNSNIVDCDDLQYNPHERGLGWDIFIKMELLTPLTKSLEKVISEEQVIQLGEDICNALILCRKRNIVHRDIKPQNIFVSQDGRYKLGDFGIAKIADRTTSGTKTGTFKYMAPEVYNNQPYGAASDIYSLGIVLYWMLNERRTPFLPLPPKVPTAIMEDDARRRRFCGETIPPPLNGSDELKRIVCKACAFSPEERYANASDMLSDLRALTEANEETIYVNQYEKTELVTSIDLSQARGEEGVFADKEEHANEQFRQKKDIISLRAATLSKQKIFLASAAAGILIVSVIVAICLIGGNQGGTQRDSSLPLPTERRMMSDAVILLSDSEIQGGITSLTVLDASENEKFHVYKATCEVTVVLNGNSETYEACLVYEIENGEWALSGQSYMK